MKIIKLFLLLSFVLWADFKLDIPQNIDVTELEKIVKNGWSEDNKTLNDLIVSNAKRVMPEILEKIKKPVLKGKVTEDNPFPMSRVLLNRDDYYFILAYCKYLEVIKNEKDLLNLYLKSLVGLNNIPPENLLNIIYHIIIEKMIVMNLQKNRNNIDELEYLKLKKLLILNTDILREGLKEELAGAVKIFSLNKKFPTKISLLIRKYNKDFIDEYMKIKNKKALMKFKKKFNRYENEIEKKYTDLMEKPYHEVNSYNDRKVF
ncbi:hypothetical protein C9926_03040, partial [Sulfurovum lithotrophicum]